MFVDPTIAFYCTCSEGTSVDPTVSCQQPPDTFENQPVDHDNVVGITEEGIQDDTTSKDVGKPKATSIDSVTTAVQTNRIWIVGDEYDDMPCDVPLVGTCIYFQ